MFAAIRLEGARVVGDAKNAAAPAQYTLESLSSGWRIALSTADRWLSESIESQLVESRDSLEELFEEELKDLDCSAAAPTVRHFRDEAKCYVFECTLPNAMPCAQVRVHFLAFESTFRQLGDMSGADSH
ncbi:MAG: hypothetical protein EXS17_04060 [Phycisphaerales bacterium]|nr:hypothetical protein [Phycisphaerales bacterium]